MAVRTHPAHTKRLLRRLGHKPCNTNGSARTQAPGGAGASGHTTSGSRRPYATTRGRPIRIHKGKNDLAKRHSSCRDSLATTTTRNDAYRSRHRRFHRSRYNNTRHKNGQLNHELAVMRGNKLNLEQQLTGRQKQPTTFLFGNTADRTSTDTTNGNPARNGRKTSRQLRGRPASIEDFQNGYNHSTTDTDQRQSTTQLKYPQTPRTALNHRGLTILVYLCREWAKLRLKNLRPWIAMWDTPELFAGVPGKGAEDAWYTTAIHVEHNQLQGIPLPGAAAHSFKCFDQILLELVTHILTAAGMPPSIISAYTRYITHLMYYNSLGTTIGKPHRHKCGIPQGCPFSMLIIALLLRPWILMMRQIPAS